MSSKRSIILEAISKARTDAAQKAEFKASLVGRRGLQGERGIRGLSGKKPIAGIDFFLPKNGKDGTDGVDGIDGRDGADGRKGIDGKDGKKGRDGKDGEDASSQDAIDEARATVKEHDKEYDHKLLHDSKMLGRLELDEDSLAEDKILQVKNNKLVAVDMPRVQTQRPAPPSVSAETRSRYRIQTVTESVAIDYLWEVILVDASSGDINLTIYSTEGQLGNHHFIKRIDDQLSNEVTFVMTGSETIDWETLHKLVNTGSGAEIFSDGSNWLIKSA